MEKTIEAIPTVYRGVQLRSRMEAQCAVLFDKLGWKWEYEKFSFMLPSGIPYIPDFWIDPPWLMVECRGYDSERGCRQIDEFVSLMEVEGGLPLPNGDGNLYEYMVIGPARATLYTAWGGDLEFAHIKASDRVRYQARPARVYGCECGWRILSDWSPWCPDCEAMADRSLIISAREGKVYVNGSSVEDFHVA